MFPYLGKQNRRKKKKTVNLSCRFDLLGQIFIEHTEEYHAEGKTKQKQQRRPNPLPQIIPHPRTLTAHSNR